MYGITIAHAIIRYVKITFFKSKVQPYIVDFDQQGLVLDRQFLQV